VQHREFLGQRLAGREAPFLSQALFFLFSSGNIPEHIGAIISEWNGSLGSDFRSLDADRAEGGQITNLSNQSTEPPILLDKMVSCPTIQFIQPNHPAADPVGQDGQITNLSNKSTRPPILLDKMVSCHSRHEQAI
jgi:hypothetical protein